MPPQAPESEASRIAEEQVARLFPMLAGAVAREFAHHATLKEMPRGAVLYEQGFPCHVVPFVVSGGSSMAVGFMEVFKQQFETARKDFPIDISEVRHATNPLTAVAEGLLVLAIEEHEDE